MAHKKRYHQTAKDKKHESKGMMLEHHKEMMKDMMRELMHEKRAEHRSEGSRSRSHNMRQKEMLGGDLYAGIGSKRAMEERDSMMISEDYNAVANLPQQVSYKPWPKSRHYVDYGLDDTISGIEHQQDLDNAKMEKHLQPEKY